MVKIVKVIPELQKLNLHQREMEIISCLYDNEMQNARQISKKINISEQKIYPYLKNLVNKNLLIANGNHPTAYRIGSSLAYKLELDKQKIEIDKAEDFLRQLAERQRRLGIEENPFYQIATMKQESLKLQLKAFNLAKKEFLQVLNVYHNPKINRSHKTQFENVILKMLDRGVIFKTIYPKDVELPQILKDNINRFEVKRLSTTFQRCDIIDERFILLKILDDEDIVNFIGTIFIDDKNLAKNLKNKFLLLWEKATYS